MIAAKLTGNRCQCTACGDLFNSTSTFDRHRVGDFAKLGELRSERCCLTPAAMAARGWSRNAAGFWIERARQASTTCAHAQCMPLPITGVAPITGAPCAHRVAS